LATGGYRTVNSFPGLTYAIAASGWGSLDRLGAPGNFALIPAGGSLEGAFEGTSDDINMFGPVAAPGRCTGEASTTVPHTYDGYVAFLTTNPSLEVTNIRDVSIGGLSGKVMDVAMVEGGDGCADGEYADILVGVDPSHGIWGIVAYPGWVAARIYVFDDNASALVVQVDDVPAGSDYGDGADWLTVADGVVASLEFPDRPRAAPSACRNLDNDIVKAA
jgi:hypothetical protein